MHASLRIYDTISNFFSLSWLKKENVELLAELLCLAKLFWKYFTLTLILTSLSRIESELMLIVYQLVFLVRLSFAPLSGDVLLDIGWFL